MYWVSVSRNSFSGRAAAAAVVALWLLAGCAGQESPEQQIRTMLDSAARAVEQRALNQVKSFISPDYLDDRQRNRGAVMGLLTGYILRHKSIHLLTQINRIELPQPGQARVSMFVAMAGRPIEAASRLIDVRADLFRVDLQLALQEGEWRVESGSWRRADRGDFLE